MKVVFLCNTEVTECGVNREIVDKNRFEECKYGYCPGKLRNPNGNWACPFGSPNELYDWAKPYFAIINEEEQ